MPGLLMPVALALAVTRSDTVPVCSGERVSQVHINTERPPFQGTAGKWRAIAHAMGFHHVTTSASVVRAFSFIHSGDECTPQRLAETERVLRSLPFLADASVRPIASSDGTVDVAITTTDEVPVRVTVALRHSIPSAFSLGNANVFGSGASVVLGAARNAPYRASGFISSSAFGLFGAPTLATVDAQRDPLGDHVDLRFARLFLSDLQRVTWAAAFRDGRDFPTIVRSGDDDQSVEVHDQRWSLGGIVRLDLRSTPLLFGPVALVNRLTPSRSSIVLADSGVVAVTDSALVSRFAALRSTRAGLLLGARRVRFVTRTGFDALFAPQDLMVGWQIGTVVAPEVARANHDILIAPSIYLGAASHRTALLGDMEIESVRMTSPGSRPSTVANVHSIAYYKPSTAFLTSVENNLSLVDHAILPTQLAMSDLMGGPRGFAGSRMVGARRDVTRMQARLAAPALIRGADLGIAVFADHGWLAAGDVPYGQSASVQSFGMSLIGAYPTRSKRTYRLDVAFPAGAAHRGLQVRFINGDPSSNFAIEPSDVTQARIAPIPSSLFTWPGR